MINNSGHCHRCRETPRLPLMIRVFWLPTTVFPPCLELGIGEKRYDGTRCAWKTQIELLCLQDWLQSQSVDAGLGKMKRRCDWI